MQWIFFLSWQPGNFSPALLRFTTADESLTIGDQKTRILMPFVLVRGSRRWSHFSVRLRVDVMNTAVTSDRDRLHGDVITAVKLGRIRLPEDVMNTAVKSSRARLYEDVMSIAVKPG